MISLILGLALTFCGETSAGRRSLEPMSGPPIFDRSQNLMPGFDMDWISRGKNITIRLRVKTTGWVGFGISPVSNPRGMKGADITICGAMPNGSNYIFDTIARGNNRPILDESQDVELLSAMEVAGYTYVVIRRKLIGDGKDDVNITTGKVGVLFAFGTGPDPSTLSQVSYHGRNRDKMSLNLLMEKPKPPTPTPPMSSTSSTKMATTIVTTNGTMMPSQDSTEPVPVPERSGAAEFDLNSLDFERREVNPTGKISVIMRVKDGNITFQLTAETQGWLGLGFSDTSGMTDSDIIMGGYDKDGPYLYDTHGLGNSVPRVDESQDVELLSGMQNDTHTSITFTRKLVATDKDDKSIVRGKSLYLLYAFGYYDLVDGPNSVNYHFLNRGSFFTDLTKSEDEDTDEEEDGSGITDEEEDDRGMTPTGTEFNGFSTGEQYLNAEKTVHLSWWNNYTTIYIRLSAPTRGWIGFGISPGKTMAKSDIIMAGVLNGKPYIVDAFARRNGAPIRDKNQDVKLIAYSENGTHTSITFQTGYIGTGPQDKLITDGPMNVIWAFGRRDVRRGKPRTGGYHGRKNRGSAKVQLVNPDFRAAFYPKSGLIVLDKKSEVVLQWVADATNVYFQFGALTDGWLGLGISPGRNMRMADMAILGVRKNGMGYAFDTWAPSNRVPHVDKSQDVTLLVYREIDGRTIVLFQRPLKAAERRFDQDITEGSLNLCWAFGQTDIALRPNSGNYHGRNRGSVQIELIPLMDGNPSLVWF